MQTNSINLQLNQKELWRPVFWSLLLANLFASMAMYMLLSIEPIIIGKHFHENLAISGTVVSIFGIGIFTWGPMANYWLDHRSRKSICLRALLFMLLFTLCTLFDLPEWIYIVARFCQGSAFGLFQIAMGSTLLIDLTQTSLRTRAAHVYYWFSRFALSLGPASALCLSLFYETRYVIWFSALCSFIAFLLVLQLKVPFRTPLDPKKFSTDRFWMKKAKPLFFTMLPTTFAMGLLLFMNLSITFFTMMMTGMLIALLLHELFFKGKDSLTEVLLGSTLLAIVFCGNLTEAFSIDHMLSGILAGAGISLITSRYLLYFIRVAEHCERGTGQSTYMLGWECGIYLGVMACSTLVLKYHKIADYLGLCSIIFSAVAYLRYTHQWFLKNCRKDIK